MPSAEHHRLLATKARHLGDFANECEGIAEGMDALEATNPLGSTHQQP